jgi:hypothetical protein
MRELLFKTEFVFLDLKDGKEATFVVLRLTAEHFSSITSSASCEKLPFWARCILQIAL